MITWSAAKKSDAVARHLQGRETERSVEARQNDGWEGMEQGNSQTGARILSLLHLALGTCSFPFCALKACYKGGVIPVLQEN